MSTKRKDKNNYKKSKIIMVGLDNAGKTSILEASQNEFVVSDTILPTKGTHINEINILGFPIFSWDLGGQEEYRDNYLNRRDTYFSDLDLMYYVIDIQDQERFDEAINYLQKILSKLIEFNENPKIMIVLNKVDQEFQKLEKWKENFSSITSKVNRIKKKFEHFSIDTCETSIYQKNSLVKMFGKGLKKISETTNIIENMLNKFTIDLKAKSSMILSKQGMIFGEFNNSTQERNILKNSALSIQSLCNFYDSIDMEQEQTLTFNLIVNKLIIKREILFTYSILKIPVYLWILLGKDYSDNFKEKLIHFKKQILPLIHSFL